MQTLLVTGGAGFIGSAFVIEAIARGHAVCVLDALTYAGNLENLKSVDKHPKYRFVKGDIRDRKLIADLLSEVRPDSLINFAAESHVDRSIEGASPFIETNIVGTFNLLQVSLEHWKKLTPENQKAFRYLQVSTDEVFGELGAQGKFAETTPYSPNSPYSASKAAADHLVHAWHHTYGLPTLITHCSNNYGPRQFPEKLIPLIIQSALARKPLPVYGRGENIRDWIHVEDHCSGIFLALARGKPGEHYCFGGNEEKQNIAVVKEICKILDELRPRPDGEQYEKQIEFVSDRLGHDWRYAIDDRKAKEELGFERKFDFHSGLLETIRWYLR